MPTSTLTKTARRRVPSLYVESDTNASRAAADFRAKGDEASATLMDRIATRPKGLWLGPEWTPDPAGTVDAAVTAGGTRRRVLVVYGIPARDGTAYSSGGCKDSWAYGAFVAAIAAGLRGRKAIVILEPDAICLIDHLTTEAFSERLENLAFAVDALTAAGASVYIDAGDSDWIAAHTVADRLVLAGVHNAAGFAINVAHTETSESEHDYAAALRGYLGSDAHYVVDTSRNGQGPGDATGEARWCNPRGRGLGTAPTLTPGVGGCDALLWIKPPGESDGTCGGGPGAGTWWLEIAMDLARNAV